MTERRSKPEVGRAERVLPGIWRLRMPLPWPGVPHGNAFAIRHGDGIVLFDTGIGGPEGTRQLDFALAGAGFSLSDVRLLVVTHAHADHYGLAAEVVEAAGCELWMHPAWGHIKSMTDDPEASLERRIEVARQSGVPPKALERYAEERKDMPPTINRAIPPDRELVPGVEVETDVGKWQVHETPGHAPSHVVLHQPESKLLISGDHLLGRVSVFFDYGHTPDPVGEFLGGLDTVAELDVDLCLAGHGKPFRGIPGKIEANREMVAGHLDQIRGALGSGEKTAFEVVAALLGEDNMNPAAAGWGLQITLAYLDHLALRGEVEVLEGTDPKRWSIAGGAAPGGA